METNWFETATPESQGIPSSAILSFIEECEKERIGIDSLIIMRNGKIVTEGYWAPFAKGDPHRLFSAGKAIVATAILFAIDEGLLHLDNTVTELLPESLPEKYSDKFDRMTLYHLLTMHTGHTEDTFAPMIRAGGDRAKTFFSLAPEKEPGTHFLYNNGVPDILGIILHKVTGKRVFEYLEPRLFRPLGMDSMHVESYHHLDELPTMTASTRSLFKLAYFFANHGEWNGKQLLSAKLVDMAGSYLAPSLQDPEPPLLAYDTQFGYGFQIWRNSVGGFRIDGGRGQFGIVIPEMNLIAAINATEQDQGALLLQFWKHITNRLFATPIQESPDSYAALQSKLAALSWAESSNACPAENIWGSYRLEQTQFGTSHISFEQLGTRVLLATDVTSGVKIDLGTCNDGRWHETCLPFIAEEATFHGHIKSGTVPGGNSAAIYSCVICREPSVLELHFRGKSFMGCNMYLIDFRNQQLTYKPYQEFARECRSNSVKHPNLDTLAVLQSKNIAIAKIQE